MIFHPGDEEYEEYLEELRFKTLHMGYMALTDVREENMHTPRPRCHMRHRLQMRQARRRFERYMERR